MTDRVNRQFRLKSRPDEDRLNSDKLFQLVEEQIRELSDGQALVRVLYIAVEPAMRGWMVDKKSYVPPVKIGEVMRAAGVGQIVASKAAKLAPGDLVSGFFGFQTHAVVTNRQVEKLPPGVTPLMSLGPLGIVGMTAYFGMLDVGKPKAGETVLVSGAAGATGSLAGQIAKIMGCRVIGVAGTDQKCKWLVDELGFDGAINYKSSNLRKELTQLTPKGIDVFFDNTGGEILQLAINRMNNHGRIVLCGAISLYNNIQQSAESKACGPDYLNLIPTRSKMEGFIVLDYQDRFQEAGMQMFKWIQEGKLKFRETILEGFEQAPRALQMLFEGGNTGKLLVRVAPESSPRSRL